MREILGDTATNTVLVSDPTQKYEKSTNDIRQELFKMGIIDSNDAERLRRHNEVIPKLHGLRKTQKPNISYRPIVGCINSPIYNLACFVQDNLAPLTSTFIRNIKNSLELV